MPASRLHLVRHGEVFNPGGVLYERLEGFGLSDLGHQMAKAAAEQLKKENVAIAKLVVSPLQRTRESAQHIAELYGIEPTIDERVIEPWNLFRGLRMGPRSVLKRPSLILKLHNPAQPSWGEPFSEIANRMNAAALQHWSDSENGDVVFVTHQLPIWMVYRSANGLKLPHNPRDRRCSLSSITSFEVIDGKLREVAYREPGIEFASQAVDGGAV
ncbi:MAG: histidine phosphatase family protein [Actinobacteria bacterium]|nr:histidine phosphatase family protein [Actinomycetota bacterium]